MPVTNVDLLTPFLTGPGEPEPPIPLTPGGYRSPILRDVDIRIGGYQVQNGRQAKIQFDTEQIEVTSWASAEKGYRQFVPGRQLFAFEFVLVGGEWQLHSIIQAAYDAGAQLAVSLSPHQTGTTTWTGYCNVITYAPLDGRAGEPVEAHVELSGVGEPRVLSNYWLATVGEVDSGAPLVVPTRWFDVSTSSEADSARSLIYRNAGALLLGPNTFLGPNTHLSSGVAANSHTLGAAHEVEVSQGLIHSPRRVTVTIATETTSSQALVRGGSIQRTLTAAHETTTSQSVQVSQSALLLGSGTYLSATTRLASGPRYPLVRIGESDHAVGIR